VIDISYTPTCDACGVADKRLTQNNLVLAMRAMTKASWVRLEGKDVCAECQLKATLVTLKGTNRT